GGVPLASPRFARFPAPPDTSRTQICPNGGTKTPRHGRALGTVRDRRHAIPIHTPLPRRAAHLLGRRSLRTARLLAQLVRRPLPARPSPPRRRVQARRLRPLVCPPPHPRPTDRRRRDAVVRHDRNDP